MSLCTGQVRQDVGRYLGDSVNDLQVQRIDPLEVAGDIRIVLPEIDALTLLPNVAEISPELMTTRET